MKAPTTGAVGLRFILGCTGQPAESPSTVDLQQHPWFAEASDEPSSAEWQVPLRL